MPFSLPAKAGRLCRATNAASAALLLALCGSLHAETARISVDVDHPGHRIPQSLWGIFFEDINHSADGGLYPELVRNLSFEDAETPENWTLSNTGAGSFLSIDSSLPLNVYNRRSLKIAANQGFTLENTGYWGMAISKGEHYQFKLAARGSDGFKAPLTVRLLDSKGAELAKGTLAAPGADWRYQTLDLLASGTDAKARLELSSEGSGSVFLDMVSLLPSTTWKNHGLRKDLAESLAALKPAFMRFPGGCWVEGDDFAHMNHWKNTVGNLDTRTSLWNIWGYNATHGLGLHEYFQLSEDLGAEPLFCINVGMSHKENVPLDKLDQWVQDALDVIEYANGPVDSVWGARRAASGHPAPFNLKYLEIGNENGDVAYAERWPVFEKAIRAKYPEMHLITNTFWVGQPYPTSPKPEIIDEHYYETANAFMGRATHYDSYDRKGPKVFIGEYAVTQGCGKGNLRAAIGEAAFMTGMERNSDVVVMASYAPLLVNLNHRAWNPDLINFDSSRWYGLPGYYVQQLFAQNRGDVVLPTKVVSPDQTLQIPSGCVGVGTWQTQAEYKDLQISTPEGKTLFTQDANTGLDAFKVLGAGQWKAENGAIQQTADATFSRAIVGEKSWKDYTVTVKARKLGGKEGFMFLFHINNEEDKILWNLGGWANAISGIESGGSATDKKPFTVETGRWYNLRMELKDNVLKCYLDGVLMHDLNLNQVGGLKSLYATASKDESTGELILKVVNGAPDALETDIDLATRETLPGDARLTVLTSASGEDENSLDNPTKVSPKSEALKIEGKKLHRSFPGNSLSILRIPVAKQ